jgi:hypothetical protein
VVDAHIKQEHVQEDYTSFCRRLVQGAHCRGDI